MGSGEVNRPRIMVVQTSLPFARCALLTLLRFASIQFVNSLCRSDSTNWPKRGLATGTFQRTGMVPSNARGSFQRESYQLLYNYVLLGRDFVDF